MFRFLFLFLIYSANAWAQAPSQEMQAFNALYQKTYLETAQSDFPKALQIADSLYRASESPLLKTKSLMLSATLYQQSGDLRKAVQYAEKSEEIISKTDDYFWRSKVQGFLGTGYRILKLYGKSREYAAKAFEASKFIPDNEQRNCNLALILQEQAYYEMDLRRYAAAVEHLKKANRYFLKITANRSHFLGSNHQMLGRNYLYLNDISEARRHYEKAYDYIKKQPENYLTGLVYSGLSEVNLKENDLKKAEFYLKKAQKIADESQYLELKNDVYKISETYYARMRNLPALEEVRMKKDTVSEKIADETSAFLNENYTKIEKKQFKAENQIRNKDYIIIGISILLVAGIGLLLTLRRRNRRLQQRFQNVMTNMKTVVEDDLDNKAFVTASMPLKLQVEDRSGLMTTETEERLLQQLEKFEKGDKYTRSNISLTFLASEFETNTKYLSYIINTYRKKDFKNYINELRIRYVIEKLRNEPVYRQYKIAVLADEAGFSSQAKFSTIFKNETSFSPSLFIRYLQEGDKSSHYPQKHF